MALNCDFQLTYRKLRKIKLVRKTVKLCIQKTLGFSNLRISALYRTGSVSNITGTGWELVLYLILLARDWTVYIRTGSESELLGQDWIVCIRTGSESDITGMGLDRLYQNCSSESDITGMGLDRLYKNWF